MMAIELAPCPFCEGPPVPFVQNNTVARGYCPELDDYGDHGRDVRAFVFCHECGADGPAFEATIYDRADFAEAERAGVELWQQRNGRHRVLFDAGNREGLNLYPRQPTTPPAPEGE